MRRQKEERRRRRSYTGALLRNFGAFKLYKIKEKINIDSSIFIDNTPTRRHTERQTDRLELRQVLSLERQ